jgi:C-terminal processing protease CtpA/Prc
MMGECPQVTTMGDHTCGSSGNPKFVELPIGVRISLPKWIDFLPDGTPLDEKGVQPDIYFPSKPEFFEGNRDDLLKAALEQAQQLP